MMSLSTLMPLLESIISMGLGMGELLLMEDSTSKTLTLAKQGYFSTANGL